MISASPIRRWMCTWARENKNFLFVEEPGIPKVRRAFYGAHSSSVLPDFLLIYA